MKSSKYFKIVIFKEFVQTKAIDVQAFVGNAAGYIDVCFGLSLLQIPYMLEYLFNKYGQKTSDPMGTQIK